MAYYVYLLKSKSKGASYVGHTQNLDIRLAEHNSGKSKSTRYSRPWELVYSEEVQTRSEAVKREQYFKSQIGRLELKSRGLL
ncbi:MAG: GIY-YIG nuclease family protein [Nitrospirae bacterium]|nr:GIY-YIG nuclease family protein [Nitrospirota bacterium]